VANHSCRLHLETDRVVQNKIKDKSSTKLAINSNLGFDQAKLNEFIDAIRPLPHVELYTSMEATGAAAEYIRDGLDYQQWMQNLHTLLDSNTVKAVHVMCTINALCLDTLPDLLNELLHLKQIYGRNRVLFTLNILRFPSFQSALVMPDELRARYRILSEHGCLTIKQSLLCTNTK
jgi:hypothetical protein